MPRAEPSEIVDTEIDSPSFEPTWKLIVDDADRSEIPLNVADEPIRSISEASWFTSDWIDV